MLPSFGRAAAEARLRGERDGKCILGTLRFYPYGEGTLVVATLDSLPDGGGDGVYALHIHEGASWEGTGYSQAGAHYAPDGRPQPCHAVDLPSVFSHKGRAVMAVYTGRFCISDIVGKTVVLHAGCDDFQSKPAGNTGEKIASGEILRNCWR